jgi:hypothetical protein
MLYENGLPFVDFQIPTELVAQIRRRFTVTDNF